MRHRYLVLTIDTIGDLFKDYIANEEDLPWDAAPIKMMFNPNEQGKIAIEFQSEYFKPNSPPLAVNFQIKRIYSAI